MISQIAHHAQLEVGQRADRERYLLFRQSFHQLRIFFRLHAVVDALYAEHIQRAPDIGGRAFLAPMGDQVQT